MWGAIFEETIVRVVRIVAAGVPSHYTVSPLSCPPQILREAVRWWDCNVTVGPILCDG